MSVSASRENARRRLMTLRRMAARVRARDLASVLWRVAAILFGLQLIYLIAANAVLRTQLIQDAVGDADGFALDFTGAYSLWLGHVHVRDLSLRVEDYNVQFEVALAHAEVDISLSQLLFKKFHITKLDAEGTRFRMRHKLIAVGDAAERVAAYPPIRGFADPPYYVGVRPPPIPDSEYDLWQVRVENVHARVSELWVMEQRFRGDGWARGSFVVKPARWVQVEPAELVLERGTLSLGAHRMAERVKGRITCDIPDMRVQESDGLQVLRDISATVKLELGGGQLDFLRAYLGDAGGVAYAGHSDWLVDVNLQRGRVEQGSRISARAIPLRLVHPFAELSGDLMLNLGRDSFGSPDELLLSVSAPRLTASRGGQNELPPELRGVAGSLRFIGTDLTQELAVGEARIAVQSANVPALSWFDRGGLAFSGKAQAALEMVRDRAGSVSGSARLGATDARLEHEGLSVGADVAGTLAFMRVPGSPAFDLKRLRVDFSEAHLHSGSKRSEPFTLSLDGAGMRVEPSQPPSLSGMVRVEVSSTEALLPLLMADPLKDLAGTALDLQRLEAQASVAYAGDDFELKLVNARSGNVRMRGYLSKRSQAPFGAFLLSSGPINVGVTLREGDTEISPFVSDEWLATAWPRLVNASRKPG
jgi:hypothetical protein